jgi:S-formylglutathione hydrolase FrmB
MNRRLRKSDLSEYPFPAGWLEGPSEGTDAGRALCAPGTELIRKTLPVLILGASVLLSFGCVSLAGATPADMPLHFRITLDRRIAPNGINGRLLVLMCDSEEEQSMLRTDFLPGASYLSAMEVEFFAPGTSLEFDPDVDAYPQPFSSMKPGKYQFMALLDPDHSLPYFGEDAGDLYGPVVVVEHLDPAHGGQIALVLDRRIDSRPPLRDTADVRLAEYQSPLLSAFWGRPITMRAGIVLPREATEQPGKRYPAVYHVHGFGGDHSEAWEAGPALVQSMASGKRMKAVHIFLNGSFPTGHHEFADSVNNGPWGKALTTEFIPWLEKKYPLISRPNARFLTGHSSGGWSTLWLQINYPESFGGAWATSPDPVDFRRFTGFDATPGSSDNAYRTAEGKPRNLAREDGREIASFEQFARQEEVQGEYGGQMASFEWVFSPKGRDGRPARLFNRVTGVQDPSVQSAWQKYDIRNLLESEWRDLEPKLRGKMHIFCGSADTFHLEEAVMLLCSFLMSVHSDAACEIVPGRDHFNLYRRYRTFPDGLDSRIDREMQARFRSNPEAPESR